MGQAALALRAQSRAPGQGRPKGGRLRWEGPLRSDLEGGVVTAWGKEVPQDGSWGPWPTEALGFCLEAD